MNHVNRNETLHKRTCVDSTGKAVVDTGSDRPAILENARHIHFSAKDVIYREGDPVDRVLMIYSGIVKLLSYLPNGRARIVRLHGPDHWLGFEGLLNKAHENTAVAIDDIEMACIPLDSFQQLEQLDPRQYCRILKLGYRYLAQDDRWIADFSTGGIKSRVARLVDFLSKLEFGDSSNRVELLTVAEMADTLGVTAESVSRVLAEYKRNNVLSRVDGSMEEIYEINPSQLQHEASR